MPGYATADDLSTYLPDLDQPDDVETYLRAASRLVSRAIRRAIYDASPTGVPTDPDLLAACRDATCEQVAAWTLAKIHPVAADASAERVLNSVSVSAGPRTVNESYAPIEAVDRGELTPQAWGILSDAGLVGGPVYAVRGR